MDGELATIACPRCHQTVAVRFYGPCDHCRGQLRATMRITPPGGPDGDTRYEPKMNVVPNQVATKD